MANISTNRILDINTDWGKDSENGLPYSGEAVQEFIKETFNKKYGHFQYDEKNNRYLVFADENSWKLYNEDPDSNRHLLLNAFDAPFNYSAKVEMISNAYVSELIGTTGINLQFKFAVEDKSGNNTGENVDCEISIVNKGVKKLINKVYTSQQGGEGVIIELDDYLEEGTNNITISIKGVNTLAATTVAVVYQIVNLKFSDNLNISKVYNNSDLLEISCVVEGAGTKVIDWYLDGEQLPYEITDEIPYITAYTVNKFISLEDLAPGLHSIQYRLRSQVGDTWFTSQTLFRNFFVSGLEDTIIGIAIELPVGVEPVRSTVLDRLYGMVQYVPYSIRYAIYNPNEAATNIVQIYLNNELKLTTNITNGIENNSSIMNSEFGNLPFKISINGVDYEMISETAVSTIGVKEITNAVINLRAFGKDNSALDKDSWTYGNYSTAFGGFYWNAQSGWVDNTLIINAGATVSIDYKPFEKDPMNVGKTIEIEFATRGVADNNAVILDLTNDDGHGLLITASEAKLVSSDNKIVSTKFKAEENNRLSFVINRRDSGNNAGFIFLYINGILSGAAEFDPTATIRVAKNIVFGGNLDILLKQIAVYDKPLSSDEILNNYILYRDSVSEMLSIYNRNNVTTEDGQLSPEKLVNALPVMYFTSLDETRGIPYLETQTGKESTKINTRFDIEYQNAQDKTKNFTLKAARVRIQGTSSSYYPRKNYRFYSSKENDAVMYDYKGDVIKKGKYSFKDGAQPVNCWCLKTDYAESSGSHNTGVAKLWNNVMKNAVIGGNNRLMTAAQNVAAKTNYEYDVRTTIDGFPIVVFYRNTENSPWQFLGKFNFNNDKSTPSVFGFCDIPEFDNSKVRCWEVLNNGHALCNFTTYSDEYFDKEWEDAFEFRYPEMPEGPDAKDYQDENGNWVDEVGYNQDTKIFEEVTLPKWIDDHIGALKGFSRWIHSTRWTDGTGAILPGLTEEEANIRKEKFASEKWDYLDVYKIAAYYIYIMRFGAVDQTVKNSMFTTDDDQRFYFINYDNDTIFGVRNDGLLKHGPYIDRQSIDPETAGTDNPYVYAGHDSVLWNNLECDSEFMEIVKTVDSALYEAGLTYSSVINMFENEQTLKWCERVCNMDAHYKYIAPPTGRVIESLQGNRNSHRRWWVSERFNLYDAKFVTGDFKNYVVELKINGEEIPFATITAAKRQPYGYTITNSASLVTDVMDIGEKCTFTSPAGQTLQVGDPISIYSACNIAELDLSGCVSCALKIDLSKITSPSIGNSMKRLIMNGDNNSLDDTTFTGTETLNRLEYIDIQGLHKLGSIDLSNSLNLKTVLAKNSGLTSIKLAPGCLIERLELPTSTAAVVLEDLPLLTCENLVLEGNWSNVRQIKMTGCPNLTNDFNLIWNWFNNTKSIENRSLELDNINWTGVHIDNLLELGRTVNTYLKGKIKISGITDKNKLIELKELFGNNIFDEDSDLYIYGDNAVFLFGPTDQVVLEGNGYQFETIVFSDMKGTLVYNISSGEREGVTLDRDTGKLTTLENGNPDENVTVVALFVGEDQSRYLDKCEITVQKRIYPNDVQIIGSGKIAEENTIYTWDTSVENVTGLYRAEWELTGDVLNYVEIKQSNEKQCVIFRNAIPETITTGTLTIRLYKNVDDSILCTSKLNISVVNPDVIMTMESNPEVLTILLNKGLTNGEYLLKSEAKLITDSDIYIDVTHSIFTSSNIKHFDEFEYFTGLTNVPQFCFSGCSSLETIKLPVSIKSIGLNAFQNTLIKTIYIPEKTTSVNVSAFVYCKNLTNIVVDNFNTAYCSCDGSIYLDAIPETLFIVAPGLEVYEMPDETTSVYGDGSSTWNVTGLKKIILNENVSGVSGTWFMYGYSDLSEITLKEGANNPNFEIYNGCLYSKDFSKIIYWPSGKPYNITEMHSDVIEIGERAFSQNKKLEYFEIPESVTKIGQFAFYNSSVSEILIPENVKEINGACFQNCSYLGIINSLPISAPILGNSVFGSKGYYVGSNAKTKELHVSANATGYNSGEWQTTLQDTLGYIIHKSL